MKILICISFAIWILILNIQVIKTEGYFNNSITEYFDNRLQLHKYARLRTPELIALRGYPVEIHHVTANDGYILEMHRIPFGIKGIGALRNITKPSVLLVLLVHGGAQSSVENRELFRPEEIRIYDLRAMIDYILNKTNQTKLHFIGFSISTTAFYILLSELPEYNDKIRLGTTFGVAAYQYHSRAFRRGCTRLVPIFEQIRRIYGSFPNPSHSIAQAIHTFFPPFCNTNTIPIIPDFCYLFFSIFYGFDDFEIPREDISLIFSKLPTSTSSKAFTHICNNVNNKRFGKFNYGTTRNLEIYGSEISPVYNLSKITAPISLYSAPGDLFCVLEDIELLNKELTNVVDFYHVPKPRFTHLDFTYGKNVGELVYKHILEIMKKY